MPDLLRLDKVLWGAAAIALEANIVDENGKPNLRTTYDYLERGVLPATKVAGRWTSTPRRLQRTFAGEDEHNSNPDQAA
jgi:hypothetical protein